MSNIPKQPTKLSIVADENMPHLDRLFSSSANITKVSGRNIDKNLLTNADALLCRSITPVNSELLAGSKVKFVGTATIGIDHLDTQWLDSEGIQWVNAAGCNAAAVAQYVISGICVWLIKQRKALSDIQVGIVGAGNVGTELARCLGCLGVSFKLCDPPLQRKGDPREFYAHEELFGCDVITFHVPIMREGQDSTFHMVDDKFLTKLNSDQLIINAARGEVINNTSLTNYLKQKYSADFILDVFENEPTINFELAKQCLSATPHIAGHSLEGKSRGSYMVYEAFCDYFKLSKLVNEKDLFPSSNVLKEMSLSENKKLLASEKLLSLDYLLKIYDIRNDTSRMLKSKATLDGDHFDALRKTYQDYFSNDPRRDYSGWLLEGEFPQAIAKLING